MALGFLKISASSCHPKSGFFVSEKEDVVKGKYAHKLQYRVQHNVAKTITSLELSVLFLPVCCKVLLHSAATPCTELATILIMSLVLSIIAYHLNI